MCILIEISQTSCKKLQIQDFTEYDLTKGKVEFAVLKVKVPGQTKFIEIPFIVDGITLLDNKILNVQKNLIDSLSDLLEGLYEFKIEITQILNGVTTFTTETFCYFNSCNIDCTISKLQLDILSNKCCDDLDCSNKLSSSYELLSTLKLYRDGIKSSAELCSKETVKELYACLKEKLSIQNVDCNCK